MKKKLIIVSVIVVLIIGIVTPQVVRGYQLEKTVQENLYMLVPSNYEEVEIEEQPTVSYSENTSEPLFFSIVEKRDFKEGGNLTKTMKGEEAYEMSSEGIELVIVPNYDKEYKYWTRADKEAYENAIQEVARIAKERYDNQVANEQNNMQNALKEVQLIQSSYSKEVLICWVVSDGDPVPIEQSELWKYNSHTKLYYVNGSGDRYTGLLDEQYNMTASDFRNIVYPDLKQKIKLYDNYSHFCDGVTEEQLSKLEWLYHLSD